MTIKDLQLELSKYPDNFIVKIFDYEFGLSDIDSVSDIKKESIYNTFLTEEEKGKTIYLN
jgi:hypothetical protein